MSIHSIRPDVLRAGSSRNDETGARNDACNNEGKLEEVLRAVDRALSARSVARVRRGSIRGGRGESDGRGRGRGLGRGGARR